MFHLECLLEPWKPIDRMFIELLLTFLIPLKSGRFRVLWHASRHPNNKYHCFSWSCSKFQCLHVSHRTVCSCYVMNVGIFQCKFDPFDLTEHFSLKVAPQHETKTEQQHLLSQNEIYSCNKTRLHRRTAISQKTLSGALSQQELCTDWLVCIACCFFWHLIGLDNLFFSNWTVCLFSKEIPLWNYTN